MEASGMAQVAVGYGNVEGVTTDSRHKESVQQTLELAKQEAGSLHEEIDALFDRLAPILRSEAESELIRGLSPVDSPKSDIRDQLESIVCRNLDARTRLATLLRRIDL